MADINVKVTFDKINVKEKIQEHKVKILMLKGEKGDTGNAVWGGITGDISTQTDLQNVLNGKASSESVATNTSNISSLQSSVATNTSDISDLQSSVATNTSNISSLQSSVATNTSDISDLQSDVATNTSDISSLQSSVATNTSDISSLQTDKVNKTINVSDPTTKNLDDYTTEGRYYFGSAPTNIPAGVNGILEVLTAPNGMVKQIWYRHGTANTNDYETYVRTYSSGWSNWKRYGMIGELVRQGVDLSNSSGLYYSNNFTNLTSYSIDIPSEYLNVTITNNTIKNVLVMTGDSGAFIINFTKNNIINSANCTTISLGLTKTVTVTGNGSTGLTITFNSTVYGGIKYLIFS